MQNKDSKIRTTITKNIINSNQKLYIRKPPKKSEVFTLFALSSSVVPLYADELEMTKSASFSTALTSLSILYRQAESLLLCNRLSFLLLLEVDGYCIEVLIIRIRIATCVYLLILLCRRLQNLVAALSA